MTKVTRTLYEAAKKNNEFLVAIKEADNDSPPRWFSSDIEKTLFSLVYYGWLVGKFGKEWRAHL